MSAAGTGLVLWAANRMPAALDERLQVAAAGGFTAMSLFPLDVRRARAAGTTAADLARRSADAGCPVTVLDPYTRWVPRWEPPGPLDDDTRAFLDVDEAEFLGMARELGVGTMTVIEPFGTAYGLDDLAEAFARTCDRAADAGLRVQLEALPWSGVPDVGTAWEVVRRAGRDNGGIVADSWLFFRGPADLDVLAAIPGERVFSVQLSDGPAQPADDLGAESTYGRRLPGDGDFDLAGFVGVLAGTGGLRGAVGPEVFSRELWARPPDDVGVALGDVTRALLPGDAGTGARRS